MKKALICFWSISLVLLFSSLFYNSITLFAEFIHSLIDSIAISFSFAVYRISKYSIQNQIYTYGLHRLEVFSAIVNSIAILSTILFISFEIIRKFLYQSIEVNGLSILLVSIISLIALLPAIRDKNGNNKTGSDMNIRSVISHVLYDTVQFIIGIIIGLSIVLTKIDYLDILGGIIIAATAIHYSLPLLRESFLILMEGSPVDIKKVETELSKVARVHHIHIWSICSELKLATLHVEASPEAKLKELEEIRLKIEDILEKKFGINHVTVQFETKSTDQATS